MGFCTDEEYWEFLRACPDFERMLVRSGITLVKYWLSVNDQEQERRFQDRAVNPLKRWKLSDVDIEARRSGWSSHGPRTSCSSTATCPARAGSRWRATTSGRRG